MHAHMNTHDTTPAALRRFFSGASDRLAAADAEGNVAVWRLACDTELGISAVQELALALGPLQGAPARVCALVLSAAVSLLRACPLGVTVRFCGWVGLLLTSAAMLGVSAHAQRQRWNGDRNMLLLCLRCAGEGQDVHLAWHPASQELLAVTVSGGVLLVDIARALAERGGSTSLACEEGELLPGVVQRRFGDNAQTSCVAFSPDGALLATGGSSGKASARLAWVLLPAMRDALACFKDMLDRWWAPFSMSLCCLAVARTACLACSPCTRGLSVLLRGCRCMCGACAAQQPGRAPRCRRSRWRCWNPTAGAPWAA